MKILLLTVTSFVMFSCGLQLEPVEAPGELEGQALGLNESHTQAAVANKNFLQINNTYSKLTGISPRQGDILDEYQAIQLQLPSSSDPETLNGFNQIASTRLAFAYCDEYVDENASSFDFTTSSTNQVELKNMLLSFVDLDFDNNSEHQEFLAHLEAIMNDDDELVNDNNSTSKKRKLMKMACAAALSSTYLTLF